MKNFFKYLTISLLAISVSCSSDDDSSSNDSVEGTFRLVSFEIENSIDLDGDGDSSTNLIEETGCYQDETLAFNSGGAGIATTRSFLDVFVVISTDSDGGETFSQTIDCVLEEDVSNFTWTQNGSVVTINVGGDTVTLSYDGNELSFTIPSGFFAEILEGDATTVQLTEDVTFRYERI